MPDLDAVIATPATLCLVLKDHLLDSARPGHGDLQDDSPAHETASVRKSSQVCWGPLWTGSLNSDTWPHHAQFRE